MYEDLSQELGYNLLFSQMGRLELAHTESSVYALRLRADANAALGVDSRIVGTDEIRKLAPLLDMREGKDLPVLAGLHHPPGGVIRHDAVIWAYARGADRKGAEIHPFTEITAINRSNGRVTGVETNRGDNSDGSGCELHGSLGFERGGDGRAGLADGHTPSTGHGDGAIEATV